MKFPIIGGVVFLLSGVAALAAVALVNPPQGNAWSSTAVSSQKPEEDGATNTVVFRVPDMHCEFACAPMVRETLAALPGVAKVETDVESQTATVMTSDEFAPDKALAALEAAGFPAKKVTQ